MSGSASRSSRGFGRSARGHRSRAHLVLLAALVPADPAAAGWSRVPDVPLGDVYSLTTAGDTLIAGVDTTVYVSSDAGATWTRGGAIPGFQSVEAVALARGALYAGSAGAGVAVSEDLGATWLPRNGGLSGGPLGSLFVNDLVRRGDSLYAATAGAGVYALRLDAAGPWTPFGTVPQANQAGGLDDLALGASRLLATGGANGLVFWNDPGMSDWVVSPLDNIGLVPGWVPSGVIWTGSHWIVAESFGGHRSADGASGWQAVGPFLGPVLETRYALVGSRVFAAINDIGAGLWTSGDHGATWELVDIQPAYVFDLAAAGTRLFAARTDGLWVRTLEDVSVPPGPPRLGLRLAGRHPVRAAASFEWSIATPAAVDLEVFDPRGRRVFHLAFGERSAGPGSATWQTDGTPPGVYLVRLTAGSERAAIRVVVL